MSVKRILPVLIMVLTIVAVSCTKGPDKLIVKTWKVSNVLSKGTYDDSTFQAIKADLLDAEITFRDNRYTMTSGGQVIESGTYRLDNGKLVVITENGLNMDAVVTRDNLTLNTPDFTTTLLPKTN